MGSSQDCWTHQYTFYSCCIFAEDMAYLPLVLEHGHLLHGNPSCWVGDATYERCCTLNDNLDQLPGWNQAVWLVKLPRRRGLGSSYLRFVNGGVLQHWREVLQLHHWPLPPKPMRTPGEGLLWLGGPAALALAHFPFRFSITPNRTFLELSAGVGAPSLIASALGFSVLSTDVRPESAWQRLVGARASFGPSSHEMHRFATSVVDLFNRSSWPSERFDIIFLSGSMEPGIDVSKVCKGFRELVSAKLRPGGRALYAREQPTYHDIDSACFQPDHLHSVSMYTHDPQNNWKWKAEEVFQWKRLLEVPRWVPKAVALFCIQPRDT